MRTQTAGIALCAIMLAGCPKKTTKPEPAPTPDAQEEVLDALDDLDQELGDFPEDAETPGSPEDGGASPFSAPSTPASDVYVPVHSLEYDDVVGC